jgi:CRISPR-associated protein Csm4
MIKTVVLEVAPNTRFHFGKASIDINTALADTDEYLHSDVLFSALVNNLAQAKDRIFVDKFVTCFNIGDIKISSGFYCIKEGETYEYLVPKPVTATNYIEDYPKIKTVKKLQFIPSTLWEVKPNDWFNENVLEIKQALIPNKKSFECIEKLYDKEIIPNLVKHKPNDNAEGPFSIAAIQIPKINNDISIHFYFLYEQNEGLSEEMKSAFEYAVNMIAFNGLGGERSSGCGFVESIKLDVNQCSFNNLHTGYKTNLGLLIPNEDEFNNCISYKLITRGGRKTKEVGQLKRVRMITEGAIIHTDGKCLGKTVALGNNHLRYGQPICISIPKFYDDERTYK